MLQTLKNAVVGRIGLGPATEWQRRVTRLVPTVRARAMEEREFRRLGSDLSLPAVAVTTIIATVGRPSVVRAVESALRQSWPDQHIVIIGDGPVAFPRFDDPRVTAVALRNRIGVVGAVRNVGIRLARSRYVAFLDDDNEWCPDHLEKTLAIADGTDIAYSGCRRVDESGKFFDRIGVEWDRERMRSNNYVDASAIVARRSCQLLFSRIPRRGCQHSEDWAFAYYHSRKYRIKYTGCDTVVYTISQPNMELVDRMRGLPERG